MNLSWTAATDNVAVTGYRVERCQGAGCSTFTQVGTPTTTSFNNTGLSAATAYSYRVRAVDAAGNLVAFSSIVSATTPAATDTTPPTAPTNLAASAVSPTQVNLSWTAATDNVAVTGYRVERCQGAGCSTFTQVATPTATSFADTGLSRGDGVLVPRAGRRRRRATSAPSARSRARRHQAAPDTTPPTAPTNLAASAASATQVNLSWTAATDNVAVTGYRVERCQGAGCSDLHAGRTPTANSFADSGLSASTAYSYRVRAVDAAGNLGPYTAIVSATTQTGGAPPPVGLVAGYSFDTGSGASVAGRVGQREHGDPGRRFLVDAGSLWRRDVVRRGEQRRARRVVTVDRLVECDDVVGVDQPVGDAVGVADDRPARGRLVLPEREPRRWARCVRRAGRNQLVRGRSDGESGGRLDARGVDLRRDHASSVRERSGRLPRTPRRARSTRRRVRCGSGETARSASTSRV